jgi:hypothetical protein
MRLRCMNLLICTLPDCCTRATKDIGRAGVSSYWEMAPPSAVGLDSVLLAKSTEDINAGRWSNIHAFLVLRHGKLVHEAYFSGRSR